MKKQIFGLMALILCACAGLTACSDDDDDDDSTDNSLLVGLWEIDAFVDWASNEGTPYDPEAWVQTSGDRIEFKSNGEVLSYVYDNGEWECAGGVYKLSGNTLTMWNDEGEKMEGTVDVLNESTFISTIRERENGIDFIGRERYHRVK